MNVSIWTKRAFKHLPAYQSVIDIPKFDVQLILLEGEKLLGLYRNIEPKDLVLVSTFGIRVLRENVWDFLHYKEIEKVNFPPEKKDINGLSIVKKNGTDFWLPIAGIRENRFYDAFDFMRFIDRVKDLF